MPGNNPTYLSFFYFLQNFGKFFSARNLSSFFFLYKFRNFQVFSFCIFFKLGNLSRDGQNLFIFFFSGFSTICYIFHGSICFLFPFLEEKFFLARFIEQGFSFKKNQNFCVYSRFLFFLTGGSSQFTKKVLQSSARPHPRRANPGSILRIHFRSGWRELNSLFLRPERSVIPIHYTP